MQDKHNAHEGTREGIGRGKAYPRDLLCALETCTRPVYSHWLCNTHYMRQLRRTRLDRPIVPRQPREEIIDSFGYRRVKAKGHPNAASNGLIPEHRLVMSNMIGRPLAKGENVHHKNGIRTDNRPENLELWVSSQPPGQRVPDIIAHAEEMLRRYAPHKLAEAGALWGGE